ncbi:MAG TPA: hypothetical protein VEH76_05435 [Methylocystis sp.]|nr:hypothetical protein [Methylocystis sp.]
MKKLLIIPAFLAMSGSALAGQSHGAFFSYGSFDSASANGSHNVGVIIQIVGPNAGSTVTLSAVMIQASPTLTIGGP